jgi:AraC-like DNA-binding protein
MLYIELQPAPPLDRFVRSLWYAQAPQLDHKRQRVLPTGRVQVIFNLARDYLLDCSESESGGERQQRISPASIIGARSVYEIIHSSDMADLIGIVFEPGGFSLFAGDAVDVFSNRSVSLEDLWGSAAVALRDRMRELATPEERLHHLENSLQFRLAFSMERNRPSRAALVDFALGRLGGAPGLASVRDVSRSTGWSERRFSQIFREEVGFSPKMWCRIQRFQRAVKGLHDGADVPWSELALDCGFYDQSHFANEFKAFSGIDATTYSTLPRTPWANHVPVV